MPPSARILKSSSAMAARTLRRIAPAKDSVSRLSVQHRSYLACAINEAFSQRGKRPVFHPDEPNGAGTRLQLDRQCFYRMLSRTELNGRSGREPKPRPSFDKPNEQLQRDGLDFRSWRLQSMRRENLFVQPARKAARLRHDPRLIDHVLEREISTLCPTTTCGCSNK
jgi:hypothetical protein